MAGQRDVVIVERVRRRAVQQCKVRRIRHDIQERRLGVALAYDPVAHDPAHRLVETC
jgi:DNA invertase Pin-like site-specific DNA recombinase